MTLKIAFVGAGYMATEHARAFAVQPGVEIVGVAGRSRSRAETLAQAYDTQVFDDVESLWRGTQADVVVVAVSELSAVDVCAEVFRHPWSCLIEKPVGVDLTDARKIQAMARDLGASRRTWVALNRRQYGSTRALLASISSDGPRLVGVLDQQDIASVLQMGTPERVAKNFMYANSIHLIDYFSFLCRGDLISVEVTAPWTPEVPGHVVATLQYAGGDRGVYQALWNGPGPWAVTVATPEARFEMRPLENLTVQLRGERSQTGIEPDPIDSEFKPGLHFQAKQMVAAAAGMRNSLASLDEAVESMALCASIYELN